MAKNIIITAGNVRLPAQLNDTDIAELVWDVLPFSGLVNTWGDEIYFAIPVTAKPQNPVSVVRKGDLGYWPEGRCFCVFFGPTPASSGAEIKPASAVEVIGTITGDPEEFKQSRDGEPVLLERAPDSGF